MKLYKLFRIENGKLYPLYVDTNNEIVMNTYLYAKEFEPTKNGKIKSKLGELSYRPGWHLTEIPLANHIGTRQPNGELYQAKNTAWCEVEIEGYDYTEHLSHRRDTFYYEGKKFKAIGNILGGICTISKYTSWAKTMLLNREKFYGIAKENNLNFDVFETEDGNWWIPADNKFILVLRRELENSKDLKRVEDYKYALRDRCMKHVPNCGYYMYKTNPNALVNWYISSNITVRRILTNEEVAQICREHGFEPQPISEI